MPRRRGRPAGSSTDDYIMGFMCGLIWLLGPSGGARELARLTIKLGQVPRGGSEASRVERLARKLLSHRFRYDTKEWRDGLMMVKWMNAQMADDPAWGPPLLDYYDTSECTSIADVMKLTPRRRGPNPKLPPRRGGPKPR